MKLLHLKFQVTKWTIDSLTINPHLNPEIEFYSIETTHSLGYVPIVGKSKKQTESFLLGFSWILTIDNKETNREIIVYEAEDEFIVNSCDHRGFTMLAKESYETFCQEFYERTYPLGLKHTLDDLDQSVIDHLYHDTLALMKLKGIS